MALALHRRLLERDPLAPEEASRLLLGPIVQQTQSRFPQLDDQLVADSVVEALLDYFDRPSRFDKGTGSELVGFLRNAAWRNAANFYRSGRRRLVREGRWAVELESARVAEDPSVGRLTEKEAQSDRERRVAQLMALLPDKVDREVLRMRLEGQRDTAAFARAMGVDHLPIAQQRKLVKQRKDRIDKVIKRAAERSGE
jgi:DNA-directed RNA polymerase specialized sigma24 family protein